MMKKVLLFVTIHVLGALCGFAQQPKAHWSFDNIRVEKQKAELVRGETYVPKEIFAYIKESVSGKEFNLNGVYYKEVSADRFHEQ